MIDLTAFSVEEENLICIFDVENRAALIGDLNNALPYFDEPELCELTENVIAKLNKMTDAEFSALIVCPAYDSEDDDIKEV